MGSSLGSCWEFAGFLALRHQYRVLQKVVFETYRDAAGKGEEMSLREALLIALRAVRAHWLRSMLTMLGLIIGVSAVILLSTCGQGVKNSVDARIETVSNNITIVPKTADVPGAPARSH
jgi:hypothetical protein